MKIVLAKKFQFPPFPKGAPTRAHRASAIATLLLLLAGCGPAGSLSTKAFAKSKTGIADRAKTVDPLSVAMVPHEGEGRTDCEIRRFQEQVRKGYNRTAAIERLGWAYVGKARESFDSGYYKLAEACALALDAGSAGGLEASLLRGHVLHNLHRFKEAEALARELVNRRGLPFDYALLGDTLMEQGRLNEAIPAYQSAIDLRPDLHSYARAAHVRWLAGDVEGAVELMKAAAGASSPQDPVSMAWTYSRLASLEFQSGSGDDAMRNCDTALETCPDYPPALLLRGRMFLAQNDAAAAIVAIENAAGKNPLPEYQWALAEALRAAGRKQDAKLVEDRLHASGATADPRTLSLYLATRGEEPGYAVRLAEEEFKQRQDVFTYDAFAWSLAAAGRVAEARQYMGRALAEGTKDARLFFHAAAIAARAGEIQEAHEWWAQADRLKHLLLPSERDQLNQLASHVASTGIRPDSTQRQIRGDPAFAFPPERETKPNP